MRNKMIKNHYKSKIPVLFQARAITFGRRIYYLDEIPPKWLIKHEMEHVRQYREHGFIGFLYRYIRDYLRGRFKGLNHHEAYYAIPFEIEARQAERM